MDELCIQMLGGFSLKLGDRELQDTDTRSKKAWALLAYLIVHRDQAVSQNRLIDLLWGSEPDSNNPENALRISMHRTRGLLEQLDPENGRSMILRRKGGYQWNGGGLVDCEQFEALCRQNTADPELRLKNLMDAISLYRGDFLPRQSPTDMEKPTAYRYAPSKRSNAAQCSSPSQYCSAKIQQAARYAPGAAFFQFTPANAHSSKITHNAQ